jgi:hypothetical protein
VLVSSRDGFQWVRPTRGSGPGPNGAFISRPPMCLEHGTWGTRNPPADGFLVVGDELWFYFSGRNDVHAGRERSGFHRLGNASTRRLLLHGCRSKPGRFDNAACAIFWQIPLRNVKDPQGSLQVQVLNSTTGAVLATSQTVSVDKTLQQITWSGLSDLSAFANQPVQFQFTLTNGELYSFWVSASISGASNGYVAANGPGFTGPTDTLGVGSYPTTVATPEIYPVGGTISSSTSVTILTRTLSSTIYYTLDGSTPKHVLARL